MSHSKVRTPAMVVSSDEDSDHFSDIFDSADSSDLTPVIGHFDRLSFEMERFGALKITGDELKMTMETPTTTTTTTTTNAGEANVAMLQHKSDSNGESKKLKAAGSNLSVNVVATVNVMERAAREIIDSEGSYVKDLREVIVGYYKDWKERACLKMDELETLFGNIEEIYEFNASLSDRLKASKGDPLTIANCFIDLKDQFHIYATYCTRYPDAISLVTRLLQATHTNALLTSTQKALAHNLPLGSYLLKPVQRILKYHLLLDNLAKQLHDESILKVVSTARDIMQEVAYHIDQVKKNLEQKSRVKQLSGILDGWLGPDLSVLGDLRQEGVLMEEHRPREVFLFDTMMIITKQKEDKRLQFKSYIHRKDIMLVEHIPGHPTSFNVIPYSDPRNQMRFTAASRNLKRLWAHNIKTVMLEDLNIPNRAKDLVFKLGYEEDMTPEHMIKKWGPTSTPDYLERRQRGRRSEMRQKSMSKRAAVKSESIVGRHISGQCANSLTCECVSVKNELVAHCNKASESGSVVGAASQTAINVYTAKTMPQRILSIKRSNTKKSTSSIFYRDLVDDGAPVPQRTESATFAGSSNEELSSLPPPPPHAPSSASTSSGRNKKAHLQRYASCSVATSEGSSSVVDKGHSMTTVSSDECNNNTMLVMAKRDQAKGQLAASNDLCASDSHINYGTADAIDKIDHHRNGVGGGGMNATCKKIPLEHNKVNPKQIYNSLRSLGTDKTAEANKSMLVHHKQGSAFLGARIANVDYADPKELFSRKSTVTTTTSSSSSTTTPTPYQRDSVFSVTSSSESGTDEVRPNCSMALDKALEGDSYYEQGIDECLEDQQRDSAVYSDDNERKQQKEITTCAMSMPMPNSPASPQPPPPVPYKPRKVQVDQQLRLAELEIRKQKRLNQSQQAASTLQ